MPKENNEFLKELEDIQKEIDRKKNEE
jgi:hypothetical protein